MADSEDQDQPARMRRLIWGFAVRICPKTRFRMRGPGLNILIDTSAFLLMYV